MFKVGIIGAGWIAAKMAETLKDCPQGCQCYAVASRTLDKAQEFARKWGVEKAYGSYEELVNDENVDLVYVATPQYLCYSNKLDFKYEC